MLRHTEAQIQEALTLFQMSSDDRKAFEAQLRAEHASAWFVVAHKQRNQTR